MTAIIDEYEAPAGTARTDFLPYAPVLVTAPDGEPREALPGELRPYHQIQFDLKRHIHPRFVKEKPGRGGSKQKYAEWHTYVRILDKYAPGWSSRITQIETTYNESKGKSRINVGVEISIPTADLGMVTRPCTGTDDEGDEVEFDPQGNQGPVGYRWGKLYEGGQYKGEGWVKRGEGFDPLSVAWSMAFRRAAALHGLGLYWRYEEGAGASSSSSSTQTRASGTARRS